MAITPMGDTDDDGSGLTGTVRDVAWVVQLEANIDSAIDGADAAVRSVAKGGTGAATLAANGIVYGNGASAVGVTAVGTATHVLTSNGAGVAPTFQEAAGGIPNPIVQDLLFTDATYDIGKSGATRPRDGFFSRNAVIGGTLNVTGTTSLVALGLTGRLKMNVASDTNVDANKNNYSPTGFTDSNFLLLTPTGVSRSITGMAAGVNGDIVYVSNQSTSLNIVLVYESGSSTGVNRFTTPGSTDVTLTPLKTAMIFYGSNRWNVALFA